jgi:tripartite-type tricarboxylate transporter receptor subunit TctC
MPFRTYRRSGRSFRARGQRLVHGIAAPKGTPPEAIEVLNKALAAALADPKMQARIAELGGTPMPMSPAEFGKLVADETEKWAAVVKSAGLSVE